MVHSMMRGGVEDPLQRAGQFVNHLCVYPELVEQVELLVNYISSWRHEEGHWNVEYL